MSNPHDAEATNRAGKLSRSPSDILYSLMDGGGTKTTRDAFNEAIVLINGFLQGHYDLEKVRDSHAFSITFGNMFTRDQYNIPIGLVPVLRQFNAEELLVIFEASRYTHVVSFTSNGIPYSGAKSFSHKSIIESVLEDLRTSLAIKLAIATLDDRGYSYPWLCSEANGIHIPEVIEMKLHQTQWRAVADDWYNEVEPGYIVEAKEHEAQWITKDMLNTALMYYSDEEPEKRRTIMANLSDTVVTKSCLAGLLAATHNHDFTEMYGDILARHARRLYGFDSSIPDDWVIKAIL